MEKSYERFVEDLVLELLGDTLCKKSQNHTELKERCDNCRKYLLSCNKECNPEAQCLWLAWEKDIKL